MSCGSTGTYVLPDGLHHDSSSATRVYGVRMWLKRVVPRNIWTDQRVLLLGQVAGEAVGCGSQWRVELGRDDTA